MTNPTIITGNIFTSQCQTLVNTVNCDGVMGAGIALEFKLRLPAMFDRYAEHCRAGRVNIGSLWLYKPPADSREQRWALNFPTKRHWKYPSKVEYLEAGLQKFLDTYQQKGIQSIAFPVLGATNGGLAEDESLAVMQRYLSQCAIPVEIYRYDPTATDDLYEEFRHKWLRSDAVAIKEYTGVGTRELRIVREALEWEHKVNSLSQLASVKGIGKKTLERCFRYVMDTPDQESAATTPFQTFTKPRLIPAD